MSARVKGIVAFVIALAVVTVALAGSGLETASPEAIVFWVAICILSEFFWVRTQSGDSVNSLAATVKLSSVVIVGPSAALLVIWLSTLTGNLVFRRTAWYKALYNASQLTLSGMTAGFVLHLLGGVSLGGYAESSSFFKGSAALVEVVSQDVFLLALLLAGLSYILVNHMVMAWLMSAVTGRRMLILLKENCLYAEELLSTASLVLMSPLLILLYGALGVFGLIALFACLGLLLAANALYMKLARTQDGMIRGERMAAMGELAEEIGVTLGGYLADLKGLAGEFTRRVERHGSERTRQSAAIVHQNVGRMAALVDGLAAFSHRRTETQPTDLDRLIRQTMEFVRPQNRFDHIAFEYVPDPALPVLEVDPGQIQQVLINLFANAADALQEVERERKTIRVETGLDARTRRVRLTVSDNGPGIPKANLARVFEPHFTTKETGHGFGLSTVFRIAANHRGQVRAANLSAGGAQFELELPAA